ncbi:MAG: NERD domain-containing protein [Anaerolineae bacterium]|nr:NERD domain-containing protein [Anaerolineae bacterium]
MENVAPVRALNRRATQLAQLGFVGLAVGAFLVIIGLVIVTIPLLPPQHELFALYTLIGRALTIIGGIILLGGIVLIARAFTRKRENDLAMQTADMLLQDPIFNERYTFIRSLNPPGVVYIDAVLVGPPGVLVFRLLDHAGKFATKRGDWLKEKSSGEWVPFEINPTKQTIDDVTHVRKFLAKRKLDDVPVFGLIVFVSPDAVLDVREPVVPVCYLGDLSRALTQEYLSKTDRISDQTAKTVRLLLLNE